MLLHSMRTRYGITNSLTIQRTINISVTIYDNNHNIVIGSGKMSPNAKITFAIAYTCGGKIKKIIKSQITLIIKLQNWLVNSITCETCIIYTFSALKLYVAL